MLKRTRPIYLDNAATTPVDPRVAAVMMRYLDHTEGFGNPASQSHEYGWFAQEGVEFARQQVSALINADPEEVVWTSGATESNNLALKGAALAYRKKGRHIVTTAIEHKSILATCRWLEAQGFDITYLHPTTEGLIDPVDLENHLRRDTVLCSIMHVNNEIGVIQDIATIGNFLRERGVLLHVDAAQSAGKVPIDVKNMGIDLLSLSAHKTYGPKGIGALYVRRRPSLRMEPQIHGGNQERGFRSGTLATHQIVGMGTAFEISMREMIPEANRLLELRERLWKNLGQLDGIHVNGHPERRIAGNLNVRVEGVDGQKLIGHLREIAISSGSACTSSTLEPSYVLQAIGLSDVLAQSSIRFTIGRFNCEEEVDRAAEMVCNVVARLRSATA